MEKTAAEKLAYEIGAKMAFVMDGGLGAATGAYMANRAAPSRADAGLRGGLMGAAGGIGGGMAGSALALALMGKVPMNAIPAMSLGLVGGGAAAGGALAGHLTGKSMASPLDDLRARLG